MELERLIGTGFNTIPFIEDLYNHYEQDPQTLDPSWREAFAFASIEAEKRSGPQRTELFIGTGDARVLELIHAYRAFGHLQAHINPLEKDPPKKPWQLKIETWGFSEKELTQDFPTFGLLPQEAAPLSQIVNVLKSIYCGKVGVEFVDFCSAEVEEWLQKRIEPKGFSLDLSIEQKRMILDYLNKSELFESFLHMKYPGQKRFSLEGGETLIPMLAGIIDKGAEEGITEFIIGMAHRGRLNVLSNILNKSYADIFSEFDEGYIQDSFEGTGDVKYHKGYFSDTISSHGHKVNISVTPNPSHLEAVDPVVEGQVKAKQIKAGNGVDKVMPLLIHGDASISGQGVVYETLQLVNLPGYSTGGTLHLIVNNQIGFTTLPQDGRSTVYCTDIAKAFGSPVFHVNGEDPEGAFSAALIALELRQKFKIDVFIDIVCYRKYGHNESDEPAYTQPLSYQIIRKKRPVRELYRDTLVADGLLEKDLSEKLEHEFKKSLQDALEKVKSPEKKANKEPVQKSQDSKLLFKHVNTGVLPATLKAIAAKISEVPEDLKINPKISSLVKDRLGMIDESPNARPIDWGMAELMAYGTLLNEGYDVRLSGQDCCRGTFSHRHAVWIDQQDAKAYFPLKHVNEKARFDVYNSPLSEYAVLGFEFGYSLVNNDALVIWEAQFGDFCNSAQIVIDQFISTGEQKWGQKIGLVMLLPHGYEGQGPEHSSARIERFLTLAGQNNMVIVNPTTPAQLFHLLRRQLLGPIKKPLIVFTPKGLLRHPECVSRLQDLSQGSFQELLDDPEKPEQTEKLVCCSGRIYYDLSNARAKNAGSGVAIIRIEQLYPFDIERMRALIEQYKGFKECIWIQEEPINMGPCTYIAPIIKELLPESVAFRTIARPRSASPAVGSHALHDNEHQELLDALFGRRQPSIFDLAGKKA